MTNPPLPTFHEGEIKMQELTGEKEIGDRNGQMVGKLIPRGALPFIEKQRFMLLTTLDDQGHHWVTPLFGEPGFVKACSQDQVQLKTDSIKSIPHENWEERIQSRPEVGILFIDLETRKRLRVNGRFRKIQDGLYRLEVIEAYPNCPKYITRRMVRSHDENTDDSTEGKTGEGSLPDDLIQLIKDSDTLFVGSSNPNRGVDASHRGGNPGFVEILDAQNLRVPDYAGNSMFNTLGNFLIQPKGGLLFLDFEKSRILQLSGTAKVFVDESNPMNRYWDFEIQQWRLTELPFSLAEEFLDYSPFNPG